MPLEEGHGISSLSSFKGELILTEERVCHVPGSVTIRRVRLPCRHFVDRGRTLGELRVDIVSQVRQVMVHGRLRFQVVVPRHLDTKH